MNNDNKSDLSVTTFQTVVVEKTKLLETLQANRDKHNSIYEAAIAGYWIEAQQVLDKKRIEFDTAVGNVAHQFNQQKDRLNADFTHQITGMHSYVEDKNKDKIGSHFSLNSSFSFSLGFNNAWPLRFPENHLEDYNRAIDLLNFSVADKVELSVGDFDAYVRNNWSWRQSFLGTNAGYAGTLIHVSGCLVPNSFALCSTGSIGGHIVTGGSSFSIANQLNRIF